MVLIAAVITFIWSLIALSEPWGYQVLESKAETTINRVNVDVVEAVISGHVKISLNPVFFPINHACGNGVVSYDFTKHIPLVHLSGGGRGEKIVPEETGYVPGTKVLTGFGELAGRLVLDESLKDMPLFFFVGLFIVYLSGKLVKHLRVHATVVQ